MKHKTLVHIWQNKTQRFILSSLIGFFPLGLIAFTLACQNLETFEKENWLFLIVNK